jgi:solute carrier family 25 thiamine pyrophosphate transporter 19
LYLCYGGLQFLTYRSINIALNSQSLPYHPPPSACSFISGALAGTVSTTCTYPLDLLRTRFAAQGPQRVYSSLLGGIKQIHAKEGSKGFYRGLAAANVQIVPYMGLFFTCYETLKPILHDSPIPLNWMGSADGLSGILASICSKTAVYPLDTVRKRLQVQGPSRAMYVHRNIPEYTTGVYGTITMILRSEGLRGMYRGLSVALLKAAPASAVTVWTFERTMAFLKQLETDKSA